MNSSLYYEFKQEKLINTYRDEAASAVSSADGQRRNTEIRLVRIGGHEIGQHYDERQCHFDTKTFPGSQCGCMCDGRL